MVKFPGIVTWNDIDISFVEIGSKGIELYNKLKEYGYNPGSNKPDGIQKKQYDDIQVLIDKIDHNGKIIEVWSLYNVFIKSIDYGNLEYATDDLVEITLTLSYDSAHLGKKAKSFLEATEGSVEAGASETTNSN
tara:strand:- start:517 stop:918 length:402 start_codon:yes stop_codon:yes gene_type:complete